MINTNDLAARVEVLEHEIAKLRIMLEVRQDEHRKEKERLVEMFTTQMKTGIVEDLSRSYERDLARQAATLIGAPSDTLGPLAKIILNVNYLQNTVTAQANELNSIKELHEHTAISEEQGALAFSSFIDEVFHHIDAVVMESVTKVLHSETINLSGDKSIDSKPTLKQLLDIYEKRKKQEPDLTLAQFAALNSINYRSLLSSRWRHKSPAPGRSKRKRAQPGVRVRTGDS